MYFFTVSLGSGLDGPRPVASMYRLKSVSMYSNTCVPDSPETQRFKSAFQQRCLRTR